MSPDAPAEHDHTGWLEGGIACVPETIRQQAAFAERDLPRDLPVGYATEAETSTERQPALACPKFNRLDQFLSCICGSQVGAEQAKRDDGRRARGLRISDLEVRAG